MQQSLTILSEKIILDEQVDCWEVLLWQNQRWALFIELVYWLLL